MSGADLDVCQISNRCQQESVGSEDERKTTITVLEVITTMTWMKIKVKVSQKLNTPLIQYPNY